MDRQVIGDLSYLGNVRFAAQFLLHALLGGKCVFEVPKDARRFVAVALANKLPLTLTATFTAVQELNQLPPRPAGGFIHEHKDEGDGAC